MIAIAAIIARPGSAAVSGARRAAGPSLSAPRIAREGTVRRLSGQRSTGGGGVPLLVRCRAMTAEAVADDQLARKVAGINWYHSIELAPGLVTPGWFDTRAVASQLPIP